MNILGVGCAAHLINNALQTSADMLPVDVESIVNKNFNIFVFLQSELKNLKSFVILWNFSTSHC